MLDDETRAYGTSIETCLADLLQNRQNRLEVPDVEDRQLERDMAKVPRAVRQPQAAPRAYAAFGRRALSSYYNKCEC